MSTASSGSGLGCVGGIIAVVLSWIVNKSVLWAILHFFCNWVYVAYWALVYTGVYTWLESLVVK